MLAQERHLQILQLLEEQGTVRTVDLAEQFECTDETIRRDFQILSDNNQLARVHGGASSLNGRPLLQSFTERRALNVDRKQAIAKAALELITPGAKPTLLIVVRLPLNSYRPYPICLTESSPTPSPCSST